MSTRTFPTFEHVNYERLMLAVCLAKRDVAKLRATDSSNFFSSLQSQDQDFLSKSTPLTKTCLVKESNYSIDNGSKTSGSSKKIFSSTAKRSCKPLTVLSSSHSLPARSDSPPVRDTDNWIPSRARPLYEPTEKQIKTTQESKLRQLDAKIAQYSAALEEIRLTRKTITSDRSKTESSKMTNRTFCSNRNSLIRSRSVPMRSRSAKPTLNCRKLVDKSLRKVNLKVGKPTELQFDLSNIIPLNTSEQCEEDSKAQELWNEAVQYLCANQSDIVFLKPEQNSYADHNKLATNSVCSASAFNENQTTVYNEQDSNVKFLEDTIKEMLKQIDDTEQEENVIRQRWSAFLIKNSLKQTTDLPSTSMKSPSLSICEKFKHPTETEKSHPTVIMKDNKKILEKASVVFSKMETEPKSVELKSVNPYSSNPVGQSHLLTLRLPTKLHRNLLKYHSEKSKAQTSLWSNLNLLTSYKYKQLKYPVRICEMLVNEIFDDVIDELFDQIDNVSSNLVNQLIQNEIYSQNSIDNSKLENLNDNSIITQTNGQNHSWASENIGEINNHIDTIPNDFNNKCTEQSIDPHHSDACTVTKKSITSTNQNDSDSTTDYSSHFEQYSTSSQLND